MGNLCYKNVREPEKKSFIQQDTEQANKQYHSNNSTNQSNDSNNNSNGNYRQYKDNNIVEQMKSKKINTKKLCRPSKVIHEQSSVYNRENDQISCASNFSGYYETINVNPNESAAISMFLQANPQGQQVKIGDTVILRNLKDHFYLFCKYQKLKKFDKQNLVKLDKQRDDHNEMYLTWKFKSIHPENNYLKQQQQQSNEENDSSSLEYESIDMGEEEIENNQCVKIQHVMTSCYLQSNKNYRHDSQSKVNQGQLVSGGPHNKITSHQQWNIEILQPNQSQYPQPLHVNQLFRIKHSETNTYLTSIQQEVCCIKIDELTKQFEEQKTDSIQECKENSNSVSKNESINDNEKGESVDTTSNPTDLIDAEAAAVPVIAESQNESDQTPTTNHGDKSKNEDQQKKDNDDKPRLSQLQVTNDIRRSERCSIDSTFQKKQPQKLYLDSFAQDQQGHNTYIDVNCKSNEQIEIANLINDEEMSENGESLFKLKQQQFLNDQINNEFYKLNNYSQQIAQQEKEMMRKKQQQFLQIISYGDLWYISEVIPHQ